MQRIAMFFYYLTRVHARMSLKFWHWVNSAYV